MKNAMINSPSWYASSKTALEAMHVKSQSESDIINLKKKL